MIPPFIAGLALSVLGILVMSKSIKKDVESEHPNTENGDRGVGGDSSHESNRISETEHRASVTPENTVEQQEENDDAIFAERKTVSTMGSNLPADTVRDQSCSDDSERSETGVINPENATDAEPLEGTKK